MADRLRLPNRRDGDVLEFEHGGRRWAAMVGRFHDGRLGEIFLDSERVDPLGELAQEAAIVASLALQHGCSLATLRHALAGRSGGPLAAALDLVEAAP